MIVLSDKHKIPFLIDDGDWESVRRYCWSINNGYPSTNVKLNGKWKPLLLHLFLLGAAPRGLEWDHRDRNKLNNQRNNLRAVTHQVNHRNEGPRVDNKTGVRGVMRTSTGWLPYLFLGQGKTVVLGVRSTLEEAQKIRIEAEQKFWGSDR